MKNRRIIVSLVVAGALTIIGITGSISADHKRSQPASEAIKRAPHSPGTAVTPAAFNQVEQRVQRPQGGAGEERTLTTPAAIDLSRWIVLVRSTSTEARETPGGNIFTFSEFEVLESVKGKYADKNLTLRVLGGKVGDIEVSKPFEMDFVVGRKYVLFLGDKNSLGYPTISPPYIFTVATESASEFVIPVPNDLPLYEAKKQIPYQNKSQRLPLNDFLYSIRKVVEK
jgi:hypothetical protein